ncbi:MAG: winged helix-turn-helix domain-containing tetratricopeptide repeat protein [Thermoanaerobaculia bacterium]
MNPLRETSIPDLGQFCIGEWSVHQSEGTLRTNGRSVRLEPRVMDVLIYLAAHSERVVPKEELMAAVWSGAFVEEGALAQAVHTLRKVLGDDARQPRFIQTIPKRGYRLVQPVTSKEPDVNEGTEQQELIQPDLTGLPAKSRWWPSLSLRDIVGVVVIVTLGLIGVYLVSRFRPNEGSGTLKVRIVVLPFENLGRPEDAFFADGLTEEITKDLASLPALQVISRTSAMQYRGAHKPLPDIGRELGVDYVLEGTVRWARGQDRVRITPQLIRVKDDSHVWAKAFEREVQNIFEVQSEISRQVISQLGISLQAKGKHVLRPPPTQNLDAYQAYLRGLEFKNQPFYSEEDLRKAVPMFERAVKLDPAFAVAWAELSQAHSYLAFNSDPSPGEVERARQAMEQAVSLEADLPAVRLAQAYFTYRCLQDFETAYKQISTAARLYPNDAEIFQALGLVLRRRGQLAVAIEAFQHAFLLDPRTVKLVWMLAETHRALREYEQADNYFNQAISLVPDLAVFWEERARNRLDWTGDVTAAREVMADAPIPENPELLPMKFQLDFYQRNYSQALARLSPEKIQKLAPQVQSRVLTLAALALERVGDYRGALAAAEENRVTLEARVARYPKEPFYRGYLAIALAQLGRKEVALAQAEQAAEQRRDDAFTGPRMIEIQAVVDVIIGRRREAIGRLARLLAMTYQSPVSVAALRLDPIWDPLREDSSFKDLLQQSGD